MAEDTAEAVVEETTETTTEETTTNAAGTEDTSTVDTSASDTDTKEDAVNDKNPYGVPEKYLNKDGTPDYERVEKGRKSLDAKMKTKNLVPAASVDEYVLDAEKFDGVQLDEEVTAAFKEQVLEQKFTPDQYNFIMDEYQKMVPTADKAESELKEAWGEDFEDNLVTALDAWEGYASDDMNLDTIKQNPTMLKLLHSIGKDMGEETNVPAGKSNTVVFSQERMDELRARPDRYTNKEVSSEITALTKAQLNQKK